MHPDTKVEPNSAPKHNPIWGTISAIDDKWSEAVRLLALPSLTGASADQQLGDVERTASSDKGGIFFWGSVNRDSKGQIDAANSTLHIEIFDNKHDNSDENGKKLGPLNLNIGADQQGFVGVEDWGDELTFRSAYCVVMFKGDQKADPFAGTMYFSNTFTNFDWVSLGHFEVKRQGFFNY